MKISSLSANKAHTASAAFWASDWSILIMPMLALVLVSFVSRAQVRSQNGAPKRSSDQIMVAHRQTHLMPLHAAGLSYLSPASVLSSSAANPSKASLSSTDGDVDTSRQKPKESTLVGSGSTKAAITPAAKAMLPTTTVLDQLVDEGRKTNLVLQQRQVELSKALNTLQDAQRLFLPSVNFNVGYTSGVGGRYIDLPVGDLLNPVYSTLNQVTQSRSFPQIENVRTSFFPQDQYDAHIRTSMPLVNPDLYYNKDIQTQQLQLRTFEVEIYERELVKNIKVAYYNYLTANSAIQTYESAFALLTKSLEISQSLVRNGKSVPAVLARIKAEQERIQSQLIDARNQTDNARRYLNFLLNRPANTAIPTNYDTDAELSKVAQLSPNQTPSISHRSELKQLQLGVDINQNLTKLSETYWYPRVNTFLDLGNQSANGLRVDARSPYVLFGLTLDMPVWNANRNRLKIAKNQLELGLAQLQQKQQTQAIELGAQVALSNVGSAWASYQAAQRQQQSATTYFDLLERAYREGTNSLIEYLDARTQLTAANTNLSIMTYRVLQAMAVWERETATYPLQTR